MKKIPTLFQRDPATSLRTVMPIVTPGCEWVLADEGSTLRKWDGTACMILHGRLYKRYDAKNGRTPPETFIPCQPEPDPITTHWPGWIEVDFARSENRWHKKAWDEHNTDPRTFLTSSLPDGTYELIGPQVNGNPERFPRHQLVRHNSTRVAIDVRSYEGLLSFFRCMDLTGVVCRDRRTRTEYIAPSIEGIVYWRDIEDPDCEKAKLKARDMGIDRSKPS